MRRLAVSVLLLAGMGVPAGSAHGAVAIGADLGMPATTASAGGYTYIHTALPATRILQSPITGVVVRWRVRNGGWDDINLRILRPIGGGFDGVGTSEPRSVTGSDTLVHEFLTRLPIQTGDQVGIDVGGNALYRGSVAGANYGYWETTSISDSSMPSAPTAGTPGLELLLNADVERDADRDGFGDETQDACPTNAGTQGACPPKKKKKCKKKKKKTGAAVAKKCKKKKKK